MTYAAIAGARLVIHGEYAHSRFFVIDVYDSKGNPYTPDFLDASLEPDPGSVNPFTTEGVSGPQYYTAYVEFAPMPAVPANNTIYAATMTDGSTPNAGGLIALRVYLPDNPIDYSGGVPLPQVSIELADGTTIPLRECDVVKENPFQPDITELLTDAAYPSAAPAVIPFPLAKNPPAWQTSTNPNLDETIGSSLPGGDPLPPTGVGLLTAPANSYMNTRISRQYGEIFVMRAKAPTSPDTRAGQWVGAPSQVRYWSVCINSTLGATQTVACLADHEFALDSDGDFTLVVSDPDHRPANAPNWLPLGDVYDGWIYMRQFLAAPDFQQAIANIPPGETAEESMGSYFPVSAYCSAAVFETSGAAGCLPQ